ncbi:hypothetical protein M9H77_28217 [Catharanthus roseus]|uniref:Uncharacterized protein n=1 Tax=Catharanthus roseus TaxID=4058 RepID=A0ACC0AF41_CATRO|nr:hypothetical protein M9H77_28217 [Catharanthus roseus]
MALPKFLLVYIFLALFYTLISSTELSDTVVSGEVTGAVSEVETSDASLRVQLDQLKSKISLLESKIDETKRMQELTSKEQTIKELEMIIEEKSNSLTSLQSQMLLIKDEASLKAKAHAHAIELEEQINNIRKEIEAQNKKKDGLEASTTIAEKKIQDLSSKLENLQRKNDEQKSQILNTRRALEVAEEELVRAKLEASSIPKQLIEVQEDAWIPPWLAVHVDYFQSLVMSNWNKHVRPALDVTKEKALEKKCEFQKWLRPRIDTFKSERIPIIREQWSTFVNNFALHLQSLTDIAVDKYRASWVSVELHVVRLKEEWVPIIRERWLEFVNNFGVHLQSLANMAIDKFHASRASIEPHVVRLKEEGVPIIRDRWFAIVNDFGLHLQSLTNWTIDKYHVTRKSVEPHVVRLQQLMHLYLRVLFGHFHSPDFHI